MGNKNTNLYNTIQTEVNNLITSYQFWTNNELCSSIEPVYYDKLLKFDKTDLINTSTIIGIKFSNSIDKNQLCKQIIEHFKDRIVLLKRIYEAIDKVKRKIDRVKSGPVCKNVDGYIEDFITCQKYNGLWINKEQYEEIIKNLSKTKLFNEHLTYVYKLEDKWKSSMNHLYNIIMILKKDTNNAISDDDFIKLRDNAELVIEKLHYITDIYYLLTINYF